ncbi:hypothetical protein FRB95_014393 [Tulasnella sp. JGI-2019a]|nr:hypothetical protein FRB95_014393 [Tulasnella sp. JGI-2019a]
MKFGELAIFTLDYNRSSTLHTAQANDTSMISANSLESALVDIHPYVLSLLTVAFTLLLLTGNPDMFDSVVNYFWRSSSHGSSSSKHSRRSEKSRSDAPRTRAQQLAAQKEDSVAPYVKAEACYYPGLVNMSGTYCFLNSPLQALASLAYLQPQMESIHEKAEEWDVPTPVVDALREILNDLNTARSSRSSLRPMAIVKALSAPDPTGMRPRSRLFSSREHQDAQELFQLISSSIQDEANEVDSESRKDLGLATVDRPDKISRKDAAKTVFEGLTANRRSCVTCGYTEAVMHFPFDNLNLAVPRASTCTLQDCLANYTQIELLNDCICRKCSMIATLRKLADEANRLAETADHPNASTNRKKRAKEAAKLQRRVEDALNESRIEDDIKDVKLEKVFSPCSTKQVMIARPPPVLVVHLNRSSFYGYGNAYKNSCRVMFPEVLDLTAYTTSGALSLKPQSPISAHQLATTSYVLSTLQEPPSPPSPTSPSSPIAGPSRIPPSTNPTLYRLSAVVCHYGGHSFGHYVCYRRKPGFGTRATTMSSSTRKQPQTLKRPRIPHPLTCPCDICAVHGRIRDSNNDEDYDPFRPPASNSGWLRISDDSVDEVGIQRVLAEAASAFMLFYERVAFMERAKKGNEGTNGTVEVPLEVDTVMKDTEKRSNMLQDDSRPVTSNGHIDGMFSPRSSEETVTQENVRFGSPTSPQAEVEEPGRFDEIAPIKSNGDPSTPRAVARDSTDSPPISFPTASKSISQLRGRIIRSVSSSRSRKASLSSSTHPSPQPSLFSHSVAIANSGPSRQNSSSASPVPLSTSPPEFEVPRPEAHTAPEREPGRKPRSASRKQSKPVNGGPKAPPRTVDLKA